VQSCADIHELLTAAAYAGQSFVILRAESSNCRARVGAAELVGGLFLRNSRPPPQNADVRTEKRMPNRQ